MYVKKDMLLTRCVFCKIEKEARQEFMRFLTWLSKHKDYKKLMEEYENG